MEKKNRVQDTQREKEREIEEKKNLVIRKIKQRSNSLKELIWDTK